MTSIDIAPPRSSHRRAALGLGAGLAAAAATAGAVLALAAPAAANHPVFVEGNCFGPGAGDTATGLAGLVTPTSCGDYDGDGRIGAAEDADGDNNYGTIGAALDAIDMNGQVTIVAHGTFPEAVMVNPRGGGAVTLEAAPGVNANIDATVQGQAGGMERLNRVGVVVDAGADTRVVLRNLTSRSWTTGFLARGNSRVVLDNVRAEGNTSYGIRAIQRARLAIQSSDVNQTGFRKTAAGVSPARPGIGIRYQGNAEGSVLDSTVTGSADAGVSLVRRGQADLQRVKAFDNQPNFRFAGRRVQI